MLHKEMCYVRTCISLQFYRAMIGFKIDIIQIVLVEEPTEVFWVSNHKG